MNGITMPKEYLGEFPPVALSCKEDLSDAYWLRTYAGMAMQGLLASTIAGELPKQWVSDHAIFYATALLKAIKESEEKNGNYMPRHTIHE